MWVPQNKRGGEMCVAACLATITFVITAFVLSGLMGDELFKLGCIFIGNYQSPANGFVTVFYNLVSLLGEPFIVGPIMGAVYLLSYRKFHATVYLLLILLNVYSASVTKQAYQDPRPFWQYSLIRELGWTACLTQYGYPSGHSWVSMLLYEPILSDFVGLGPYRAGIIVILLTGTLIPLSRLYLGVHSTDQVLTGLVCSIGSIILYRYLLQRRMFQYLHSCLTQLSLKTILLTVGAHIVALIIPIILFEVNTQHRQLSAGTLANLNRVCNKQLTIYELEKKHSTDSTLISAMFGMIYGVMIASKLSSHWWVSYYYGNWSYTTIKNVVYKLLIYIVILVGATVLPSVVIPIWIHNFYGSYIIKTIGFTAGGIVVTFLAPYCAHRYGVISAKEETPIDKISSEL